MASNFAFQPMGQSAVMTVGGAAPSTISLVVQGVGQTVTQTLAAGNYPPGCVRIVNEGTASAFINFGATAAAVSTSPTIGMRILANTSAVFRTGLMPFLAAVCASTFTVTLSVTPGEGIA